MRLFESRTVLIVIGVLAQLSCLVSSLPKACPKFDVLYGRTRSRSRGRAMRITCNRGYNLIGERTLLCNKGKWDSEIPVCAKPGCPLPESRIPNGKVLSSYNHQIIRTVCEDGFEMQGSPIIFCNGIVWNDTLPVCLGKPGVKACDFEGKDQFCGWHQTRNMLTWQMGYDPLEAWVAWGPDFDHTFGVGGFGHYIHMKGPTEATRYLTFGQLKSPTYRKPDNPDVCFQFWFHVYGEEAGDLKILVNREEVWKRQQINRKLWQRGSLHFVANSTYQITIEASVPSALVTVALDDLEVIENCTKTDYVLGTASSCEGRCGDDGTLDDCSCDYDCHEVDNCCPDLSFYCPNIALGTDTTVIMETSAVTSKGDIPVTTFLPLVENETVASPSEETTLHPNIVDQNINQDQSQGVEENQNINIIASQTPIDNNQENNNIEKVYENTEQVQEKINNSSGERTQESSNKGIVEENQNINVIASQTPVDNNQENNNIEVNQKDINENIEHLQEKISNSTSQRTEDNFNNGIQENNLGNAGNENQEIDVPFDNINTTTSEQTSDNMQGTSSPSNVDTSLDTNQEKSPSERFIENSIASNKTFYKLGVDKSNQNDKTSFEYNGNVYQNFPQNKNRMRGSVKKSTVVYEEEENQLNPTQILSNETKTKEYSFEAITRGYQVINNNNTKVDESIIIQNTTIKDEDQTLTEQHSNLENVTIDTQTGIPTNGSIIFSNDTDLMKENVDAINNKEMESKLANTTKDEQNIVENNIGPSENETLVSKTNEMNTENMTKSNNNENPSAFNRNFTKIILYKNFNYDNSSGTNASHIQHMNDISRVQIHTTVQSNGTQVVENVNMNDIGKYNETTIARLKQIHDHINNVITAKKNVTQAANASQVENNNATVLHKLKNFITNIIESHNNSKLLTNNTENTETASNVSPTEQDTEELSSQMNRTLNVTHHNTTESIYSDGLLMLSDKVADYNTSKPVNSTEIPINQDNPGLKKPSEDIDQTADKDEKYIKQVNQTNRNFYIQDSTYKPEPNITRLAEDTKKYNKNPDFESLDYKIINAYQNETYEGLGKILSGPDNRTSGDVDNILNHKMNTFVRDRNFYSGNVNLVADSNTASGKDNVLNATSSSTTYSTPSSPASSTRTYLMSPVTRYKPRYFVTRRPMVFNYSSTARSALREFLKKLNVTSNASNVTSNPLSTYRPLRNSTYFSFWRTRKPTSTLSPNTATTIRNLEYNTSRSPSRFATTPSTIDVVSISLLKSTVNMTDGMFTKNKDKQYKYEVWEETTTTSTVKEHIIIQAASSKNDSTNNALRSSTSSLVSAISIVLVALTVLLSSLTSYCLVQKYRRKRADDTEIEFLTGDELLYFHTPSPHLRSHRNPEPEVDDNMRSF